MTRRQQVITSIDCDMCDDPHEGVDSFRVLIARGRARPAPRIVDVCEHWAETLNGIAERVRKLPVADSIDESDQPALPLSDVAARRCPLCVWSGTPHGLLMHMGRAHDIRVKQPRKCPDCPYSTDNSGNMVQHRSRLHGFMHLDAAIAVAEKRKPK